MFIEGGEVTLFLFWKLYKIAKFVLFTIVLENNAITETVEG